VCGNEGELLLLVFVDLLVDAVCEAEGVEGVEELDDGGLQVEFRFGVNHLFLHM
jgi:hypothetical protein